LFDEAMLVLGWGFIVILMQGKLCLAPSSTFSMQFGMMLCRFIAFLCMLKVLANRFYREFATYFIVGKLMQLSLHLQIF